ncbi:ABC transporter permease [Shewanella waksmanii]|uniref:ABC transporter permease n=1 Tax=Shewanella waksmanii TaxID=213783 RepID=UPI0004B42CEF|nr:FtsX-like permease family protein [Shewanella waksmanii]
MMLFKLGWRNLWRQKRRTLITAFAIALALFLSLFMRSMQEGAYQNNIDNSARFATGLLQLQHPDFSDSQSIEDILPGSDEFIAAAKSLDHISFILPRIESFALAAAGDKSKGVAVIGAVPSLEQPYSGIGDKVVAGELLKDVDEGVMIGQGLADWLKVELGDELVLYGQGYRGQTAAGLYPIKAIVRFPLPQLDKRLVYLPLSSAQQLFSTGEQVTAWVLHTDEIAQVARVKQQLIQAYAGQAVNVRDWLQMAPQMAQQIAMDKAGGVFMMYLLYGIVGFGLFATILMMTLERQREFAVMLATGLQRVKLLQLIVIESSLIALLGMLMGLALAIPLIGYFYFNPIELTGDTAQVMLDMGWEPIVPMSVSMQLAVDQLLVVSLLMLICLLYPLWRAYHLDVVSGLKGDQHG